jgi:queuosine precursor transporter
MNLINFSDVNKSLAVKLMLVHVVIIGFANYIVQYPVEFLGIKATWAMFLFPLVLVATDLTVRLTNKSQARVVVGLAFLPALVISAFLSNWRIGLASAVAYLIGQLFDVTVFQRIREKFSVWWAAPLASGIFANIVDTYSFFGTAFYNSANEYMAANWLNIANADVVFKTIISLIIILPIYGIILNRLLNRANSN